MKQIEVYSMPETCFAHVHKADRYGGTFPVSSNGIEIAYIAEGQLTVGQDGEMYTAVKGDVICLAPDSPITVGADVFHCHHTVGMTVRWDRTDKLNGLYLPLFIESAKGTDEIIGMIDECIYKPYLTDGSSAKDAARLLNILCKIDELCRKAGNFKQSEGSVLAVKAVKYIHKNIHSPITQAEVAKHLGVSTGYLCNVFKKAHGVTLIKYVNKVKLKGVQSIMEKENMKLCDAAELFGYSDANYVSALYKRMFGRNITEKPNLSGQ